MLLQFLRNAFRKNSASVPLSQAPASAEAVRKARAAIDQAAKAANTGDNATAIKRYRHALTFMPESVDARHGLSVVLLKNGEPQEAYQLAVGLTLEDPSLGEVWRVRALTALDLGILEDAVNSGEIAATHRPEPGIVSFVGIAQFRQGKVLQAIDSFEKALALNPVEDSIHSNRLFALSSHYGGSNELVVAAHMAWGHEAEQRIRVLVAPHKGERSPDRPLRVGYVSADFRTHPVAALIEPILRHHDRSQFHVTCYDNQSGLPDEVTGSLRSLSDAWCSVTKLNDRAMARRIHDDAIDVLVDLSGHTAGNRLPVFAMRPAPVQVSWFGYMNTTGLTRMDYRLAVNALSPSGTEANYSETLFRVPALVAWAPPTTALDPGEPPCLTNGYVTFGSFNSWAKITDEVIEVWCKLLLQCRGAKIHIVAPGGQTLEVKNSIEARFASFDVKANRLIVTPTTNMSEFLEKLKTIDISLDPFPYNGGTTSYCSLWMGVPFISMATPGELGQAGSALLEAVGLAELCANNKEEYVAKVLNIASNTKKLREIRHTLRDKLIATGVTDGLPVTKVIESAYRAMWHNHVQGNKKCIDLAG